MASAQVKPAAAGPAGTVAVGVHAIPARGIENFYQLNDRVYSGAAPEGDAGFAALQARGIKTIITVDGAAPDVVAARKYGLRYVHLPIGYDGISSNQAVRLVKAAETLPGPVFVHCHHGLHRGPAGAAVICQGIDGWSPDQAVAWLQLAGTATNYAGLYASVRQFHAPSPAELRTVPADFPEQSRISPLADVMVQIDQRFDHLKLIRKADFKAPPGTPDLDPRNEALQLEELFKELLRNPVTEKRGKEFRELLQQAEQASGVLEAQLKPAVVDRTKAEAGFRRLSESCNACHQKQRN